MPCILLGEVFPAVAGIFFVLSKIITNGFGYLCDSAGVVEAHSVKGPAFTNGFGFGYSQLMIQSINPQ